MFNYFFGRNLLLKAKFITLASSELAPNMFASSELVRSWNLAYHLTC